MHDYLQEARRAYEAEFHASLLRGQDALKYLGERAEAFRTTGELPGQVAEILVPDDLPLSRAYGTFDETGFRLTSGRADFDRHPNVFYSPLTERELRGQPVRDTDPGNYQYVLEKDYGGSHP